MITTVIQWDLHHMILELYSYVIFGATVPLHSTMLTDWLLDLSYGFV